MASSTTITILEARLRLVRIPRGQLHASMAQILDCWWFRRETDPFFALCLNQLEVSLFADAQVVSRTFGEYMDDDASSTSSDDVASSSEDDEAEDLQDADSARDEDDEALAGTSGITLGQGDFKARRIRDRERRRDERKLEKEERRRTEEAGEERIKVGEVVWVALEIAFHGDGWESAGLRVHALSRPLAESGISILFLSTYQADFILVKEDALVEVTSILESSGFQFNAADDSDEDESALADSMASLGGLSRRASQRRQRGESSSTAASGGGRPRSNGSSLAGSLTLSDRGSIGGSSGKSSTPSTTVSMSRSASASRAASAAQAGRPSSSRHSALATIDADNSPSPVDASSSKYTTSPSDYATPITLPPYPSPRPPPSAFTPGTSLTLLPDELVCVGLAQGEPSETLWRTKIVTALFYPERVLPRPDEPVEWDGKSRRKSSRRDESRKGRKHEWEKSQGSTPTASTSLFPHSPTHSPSPSRSSSLRHSRRPHSHSRPQPAAMSRTSTNQSTSTNTTSSSFPSHLAGSVSTSLSGPPVPFIALTQTADGTSLTADVRLLRVLFSADGSAVGQSEEELVYAVGSGGLRGVWAGEEGESEGEYDGKEESGYSESEMEMEGVPRSLSRSRGSRGRGSVLSSEEEEGSASASDAGEEGESEGEYDGKEESGCSESEMEMEGVPRSLSRSRGSRGRGSVLSSEEEEGSASASEAEEWEHLEREDLARERRERREKARQAGEGGRRLLKCLQVDLVAFGLDKHGIVEQIAGILGAVGINCLYQSTYSSANILVSKNDIARARIALEEHGRERSLAV